MFFDFLFFAISLLYYAHMEWSFVRKLKVIGIVGGVVIALFFLLFWNALFPVPTCFDGRENGGEQGRDCGGSCTLYCPAQMRLVKVISARSFPIATGIIHSVAFLEQTNREASARSVPYEFVYFDAEGKEIARRAGKTTVSAFGKFVIIETLIEVPSIPAYTTFSFTQEPVWEKVSTLLAYPAVITKNSVATSFALGTRVTAEIENQTEYTFSDTFFSVLVYGNDGNVQAVSSVKVISLPAKQSTSLVATWPFRFREPVSKIEILPSLNPFTAESL